MTKDKDLKRLIRARMQKTGEAYTAARANLLANSPPPLPDDYEKIAGMSDDAVSKASGKTWPEWAAILDRVKASTMEHRAIVEHVYENYDVSGWWAQMITVSYERFRGLRDVGQRRGGGYDVNKSKTIAVPVADLWRAFEDEAVRSEWLPGVEWTIRTSTEPKSMRVRLADDAPLDAYFTAKGDGKSAVSLQQRGLPDKDAAEETKAFWGERLEQLKSMLASS